MKVKKAAIKTLNTVAFDSIPKVVEHAEGELDFRKNARQALGYRVNKARTTSLEAEVWSNRGWLRYHLEEGTRKAQQGWRVGGKKYILVPVEKNAFTRKNRLKAGYRRNLYVVPKGREAYVFYRAKRGSRDSILIGVLKPQVKYHEDIKPHEVINRTFIKKANRLFNYYLDRA